jgi:hypothetical protein
LLARFEERGQGCGVGVDRLVEEAVEEHAGAASDAAVEPEGVLVEVVGSWWSATA